MKFELPKDHGLSGAIVANLVFREDEKPALTDAQFEALRAGVGRGDSALVYPGRLDAPRAKWVFSRLEAGLRSPRTEEPVPLALDSLDIDHVLPTSWLEHWPLPDGAKASAADINASILASYSDQPLSVRHASIRRRESAKAKIGNLTLLHYGVNRGLQNHGFDRKREALFAESNLQLNRELMRLDSWDEDAIESRGRNLFEVARQLWQCSAEPR